MQPHNVNLSNYSGLWCIEPQRFNQMIEHVNRINLTAHIEAQEPATFEARDRHFATTNDGEIAVIEVMGTMTKRGSSFGGGGTVRARRAIRQAEQDTNVRGMIIRFDTPGGTVAGTSDLATEIANTSKPVFGFVEDLCASAGMWCAAQCDSLYANSATAQVGSIGTFMALYDISKALEEEQIRTIVVKAGEFKGGGFPGMEVSDEQVAEWQKRVDAMQAEFTAAIASGRNMSVQQAEQLVTGLTYMANDAIGLKLIDGIKTFDEVVEELRSQTSGGRPAMSKETTTPTAATFDEVVAACPGIDSKNEQDALFITECMQGKLTASEATEHYCDALRDQLTASQERVTELEAKVTELEAEVTELKSKKGKGAPSVGTQAGGNGSESDARADWDEAIAAEQKKGKTRVQAVKAVNAKNPELREAMLAAANN